MADDADKERKLEEQFWAELDRSPFMMVGLAGVDDSFTRPMTAQVDGGKIYFFADNTEDLVKGLQRSSRAIATFAAKDHGLFASVHGKLAVDDDHAVIDRLWNPIIASWYEDGKDDRKLTLLRFDADGADVWEANLGSTLKAAVFKMLGRDPGKQHQQEKRAEIAL